MTQLVMGGRSGVRTGESDIVVDIEMISWIFEVANKEHNVIEL